MLPLTRLQPTLFPSRYEQFFHFRHHLVFSWTLVLMLVYSDKATLQGLARLGPNHLCEWHLRRLLCASYWCWRMVLGPLAVLPPDGAGQVLLLSVPIRPRAPSIRWSKSQSL